MPRFFKFRLPGDTQHWAFCDVPDGMDPKHCGIPSGAIEVDRMPGDFETHENGQWVTDNAAKAEAQEDARLRLMTPGQRQREAVAKAKDDMRAEMRSEMAALKAELRGKP